LNDSTAETLIGREIYIVPGFSRLAMRPGASSSCIATGAADDFVMQIGSLARGG
jgi:hypothetical protein